MIHKRGILPVSLLLASLGLGGWMLAQQMFSVPDRIDLDKDQAIQLIQLQMQVETAIRVRDEFVVVLYNSNRITPETHQLNISQGAFLAVEVVEDAEQQGVTP